MGGSYNAQIIKATEARAAQLKALGVDYDLITVGKKGTTYFKRRSDTYDIPVTYDCPQAPTADFANGIAEKLLAKYLSGDSDRIEVIYTKFVSLLKTEPTISILLPRNQYELADELDEKSADGKATESEEEMESLLYEQEPKTLLDSILPLYFNSQVLRSVQDGVASELASRMTAMSSASDNAKSLKKGLTLEMNRARQAAVTQQLCEIVAGADAAR